MSIIEVGSLRSERAKLTKLIGELTEQRTAKVMRDDRTVTTHTAPSFLEELRQAVAVGGESTGMGASAPGSRLPLAPNAADTLALIEERVLRLHLQATRAGGVALEERLRMLRKLALGWSDAGDVAWANDELQRLIDIIGDTLTPARRFTLRRPCPSCGVAVVARVDELGETVMVPALTVDDRTGAHCAACNLRWPPTQVRWLAELVEQQDQDARRAYEDARTTEDPEWDELDEDTRRAWREWRPDNDDESVAAAPADDEPRCKTTELIRLQCAHCKRGAGSAE
jgi:hypothetical protein